MNGRGSRQGAVPREMTRLTDRLAASVGGNTAELVKKRNSAPLLVKEEALRPYLESTVMLMSICAKKSGGVSPVSDLENNHGPDSEFDKEVSSDLISNSESSLFTSAVGSPPSSSCNTESRSCSSLNASRSSSCDRSHSLPAVGSSSSSRVDSESRSCSSHSASRSSSSDRSHGIPAVGSSSSLRVDTECRSFYSHNASRSSSSDRPHIIPREILSAIAELRSTDTLRSPKEGYEANSIRMRNNTYPDSGHSDFTFDDSELPSSIDSFSSSPRSHRIKRQEHLLSNLSKEASHRMKLLEHLISQVVAGEAKDWMFDIIKSEAHILDRLYETDRLYERRSLKRR